MGCISCGTRLPEGAAFCPRCGTPQAAPGCAHCGAELVPPGAAFCFRCGTPVAPAGPAPAAVVERRLTSVLFADLVGYTTLSESRDTEDVRDLRSGIELLDGVRGHGRQRLGVQGRVGPSRDEV